jgi:hypothetical protein
MVEIYTEKLRSEARGERDIDEDVQSRAVRHARGVLSSERWSARQYDNPEGSPASRFMKPLLANLPGNGSRQPDTVLYVGRPFKLAYLTLTA